MFKTKRKVKLHKEKLRHNKKPRREIRKEPIKRKGPSAKYGDVMKNAAESAVQK
jgi:hypothetical protein